MNTAHRAGFIVSAMLIALTSCSLSRDTPALDQYVLGGQPASATAAVDNGGGLAIGVRRLDLAPYLAIPAIVVRRGDHQIVVSQYHRWGEDLDEGINRAVARYLAATPTVRSAQVAPWPLRAPHDFIVQIRVSRFEGTTDQDVAEGGAHVVATWEIVQPGGGPVLAVGGTDFRESGWAVGDYADLVMRLDRGLTHMAADIAACLTRVAAAAPGDPAGVVPVPRISCAPRVSMR
jgi:uncharacterized protein